MPRFVDGVPVTLGFVKHSTNVIEPYPNYKWHSSGGTDCEYMTSVFRVAFDTCNQMWVLDSGKIGSKQVCQPQLLIFNLATDSLVKRYRIPQSLIVDTTLLITPVSGWRCLTHPGCNSINCTGSRRARSQHMPRRARVHGRLLQLQHDCVRLRERAVVASEQQAGE
jgi:hypothetical protein